MSSRPARAKTAYEARKKEKVHRFGNEPKEL